MTQRPNIVCFITDDTGFNMLGYAGGPVLTPNIDSIAREGVVCSNFFTAAPACTPSRFSYLTGLYPGHCLAPRYRAENPAGSQARVDFNVDVLPGSVNYGSLFQKAGYQTAYVGKWHTGIPRRELNGFRYKPDDDPARPEVAAKLEKDYASMLEQVKGAGFDFADGVVWGNTDGRPIKALQEHNLEWTTAAALDFLDNHLDTDRPFFLTMDTTTIHGPHHIDSMETDGRQTERGYIDAMPEVQPPRHSVISRLQAAGVEVNHQSAGALWMDDAFGAVMGKVHELGLADDTIFIWSTDHGPGTIDGKFSCYDGGVRIPFCMKWKGRISPGGRCDAPIQNIDFLPTLMDMAGLTPSSDLKIDGVSRWPQIQGRPDSREELYFEWGLTRAIRTRKWKYIAWRHSPDQIEAMKSGKVPMAYNTRGVPQGEFCMHFYPHYFDPDQLFDLESDPREQRNLANDPAYADVLTEMRERLWKKLESFDHLFPRDADPFVHSKAYNALCKKTMEDQSMREADWFKRKAY